MTSITKRMTITRTATPTMNTKSTVRIINVSITNPGSAPDMEDPPDERAPMTGLKESSTLGQNPGHVSASLAQGDTVQFTTEVRGNADHIHVAANGPYHQGPPRTLISGSSVACWLGAPIG